MKTKQQIAIIGGGITGLAAAYRLRTLAPAAAITLFEASGHLGGKLVTEQVDGFLVEGGPDCFLARKPRGIGLCQELGIETRLHGRDPRYARTYVRRYGELHRLPEGLSGMVPADLDALERSTLISPAGRQRVAQEPSLPPAPANGDESIAAFMTRRMGREVYEQLVEPLMSGIYAGDGEQLSLAATFPQLRALELEHGSLIRGLQAAQAKTTGANGSAPAYPPFVSFPDGMQSLVHGLIAQLGDVEIRTRTPVAGVERHGAGYRILSVDGRVVEADTLIVTTPAFVTAKLLRRVDPLLAQAHSGIPYASSATVSLAFAAEAVGHPLDGYGYVIPRVEEVDVLACTWTSRKWRGRAPVDGLLLRVYLGRFGGRDVLAEDDAWLVARSRQELRETLGITAQPRFSRVYRWPRGMPQYVMGHTDRLQQIWARVAELPGLAVAGAAYQGVGIPDCIHSGEAAAQTVAAVL